MKRKVQTTWVLQFTALQDNNPFLEPEPESCCLWFYRGEGCPPYVGSMIDNDFPGVKEFFCWCPCPEPPPAFIGQYNEPGQKKI